MKTNQPNLTFMHKQTKQLKDYNDQEILEEARKRLQKTEPIDLLEDIGNLIKDQRINNN